MYMSSHKMLEAKIMYDSLKRCEEEIDTSIQSVADTISNGINFRKKLNISSTITSTSVTNLSQAIKYLALAQEEMSKVHTEFKDIADRLNIDIVALVGEPDDKPNPKKAQPSTR